MIFYPKFPIDIDIDYLSMISQIPLSTSIPTFFKIVNISGYRYIEHRYVGASLPPKISWFEESLSSRLLKLKVTTLSTLRVSF